MTSRWNRGCSVGAPSPVYFLADDGPENSKSARLYTRRHDGEEPFGERYHPISSLRRLDGGRSSAAHIRNSQAVYHLTTAEIIDLKESGVSEKVIDFMINTASAHR